MTRPAAVSVFSRSLLTSLLTTALDFGTLVGLTELAGVNYVLATWIGTVVGTALCIIPGIIFAFLAQFAVPFVVDRSLSPVESIKASIATVRSNLGGALLSWIVQYAVVLVGELLCAIGLVVAFPIAQLIQIYTYRKLSGGQVVPVAQPGYQPGPSTGPPSGPQPA